MDSPIIVTGYRSMIPAKDGFVRVFTKAQHIVLGSTKKLFDEELKL